jgi:hypothetical protein
MLSMEEFELQIAPLRAALELRRRKFLRYYYAGFIIALPLVLTAFCCPFMVLHAIQALFRMHAPLKLSDAASYRLFAILCSLLLIGGPVISYRGERGFSVERAIYSRILGHFGPFIAVPGGGITAAEVRKSGISGGELFFRPEEGAVGELNERRVRLCDAVLLRREEARDTVVFRGLFVLCDRPSGAALAPALPKDDLTEDLSALSLAAHALASKRPRWDERFVYGVTALYALLKEAIIFRWGKEELESEKAYRLKYALRPHIKRAGAPEAKDAAYTGAMVALKPNSCFALISAPAPLFTLGSLFHPALSEEKTKYIHGVMTSAAMLTTHVN